MKLGIAMTLPHSSPDEWAKLHSDFGLSSVVFPCGYTDSTAVIDSYVRAAADYSLTIAEVGCWSNPNSPDKSKADFAATHCRESLALADYVGAKCCVNITGAFGDVWDGGYAENYSDAAYEKIVDFTQRTIDAVKPTRTVYTLEPMPHMLPDSPESYLRLLRDVDRQGFGVHMDVVNMLNSPQLYFNSADFVDHCFDLLGNFTASCHLKDCVITHKLPISIRETTCGDGGFDIPHYLEVIDRTSIDMPVIIEHLDDAALFKNAVDYVEKVKRGQNG